VARRYSEILCTPANTYLPKYKVPLKAVVLLFSFSQTE